MKYLLPLLLCGCAHTPLYSHGQKIAHFEGDMDGLRYAQRADGSTTLDAVDINHSIPTKAQGEAAAGKLRAFEGVVAGAAAALGAKGL